MENNELVIKIEVEVKRWNTYREAESSGKIELTIPENMGASVIPDVQSVIQGIVERCMSDYYAQRRQEAQEDMESNDDE